MPFNDTRTWICPALCGCAIQLTAYWVKEPDASSETYQHPLPRTITAVNIKNVCAEHDHLRTDPVAADPYGGAPGYFDPALAVSEAEKLYVGLFRYSGQTVKLDTCGCKIYEAFDRFGNEQSRRPTHPKHTHCCRTHEGDTEHTAAIQDNIRKNEAVNVIRAAHPELAPEDIEWSFDDQRDLQLTAPKLDASARAALRATLPGKVNLR